MAGSVEDRIAELERRVELLFVVAAVALAGQDDAQVALQAAPLLIAYHQNPSPENHRAVLDALTPVLESQVAPGP